MSSKKPWVDPLNIKINDYENWLNQVEPHQSVTYWALIKGKLRAKNYLLWAREHYQLPVLKDSYFAENCNHQLWSQIQSVANWSPEMLPLEQWDGVVFIGCVEPPVDVKWSFPVSYVLASGRSLKKHWQVLQDGESHSSDLSNEPTVVMSELPILESENSSEQTKSVVIPLIPPVPQSVEVDEDAPQIPSLDALAQDELPQIPTLPDEEPHGIPSIPAL
ncbi:MAG: hypothetical protein KDD34_05650, partial [Bdellovibrionales bacterium]|nr:hypothetical protein [Bdellovibrionales bacterium]